ncbi:hypothetical protein [Olsenella intestinalis]|uniref:hypothetical protein n=1 Tax=Olsenella intestinalis TaxID=2930083 RepID=UPI00200CA2DC|nr:hypothetical protein [Olsenella intestinalis]
MAESVSEMIRRLGMSEGDFRQDSVAINKALNAGARVSNLQVMTIHTTKKGWGKLKSACENCTAAFMGYVAGNYSGWKW